MSTPYEDRLLYLLGMQRTGKITPEEFLKGIRLARICASRTEAERAAYQLLSIHGRHPSYANKYALAVGHLARHRLIVSIEVFSSLFVKLLMDACITVAETERVLDFSASDYRAGALELIRLFKDGKISRNEVHLAFTAAVTARSQGEAERFAQQLLFQGRRESFTDATPLEFAFCATCLYLVGEWSGVEALHEMITEIKRAVEDAEDQKIATAPTVFDPTIPRPLVVRTMTELLYLGRPDENGFRDVAMTPPNPGEKVLPPRMAQILGSGFFAQRGPLQGFVGHREIEIGHPMILRPPQPPEGIELWATAAVVSVEIL